MRLSDFETMVRGMAAEIPEEFLLGVADISVSPRTLEHSDRDGIYTLGECIPLPATSDDRDAFQSRVVLYHGSFAAVARDHADFDWREEAWETLTHEIRHHVEWRARVPELEALDAAAEQNYARHDGEPFDPAFYRDGERLRGGVFRVEDDYFIEVSPPASRERMAAFAWDGRRYRVALPAGVSGPAFLSVRGVANPPAGELVLVLPRRAAWWNLLQRPAVQEMSVEAVPDP